jgi:ubiquinol-cytochrome c reductase cytochrome b subunit
MPFRPRWAVRLVRSTRRVFAAADDRLGLSPVIGKLLKHPVPSGAGWLYVFGSATLLAFTIQVVTGIALAMAYVPSSGQAYDSLRFISSDAPFGHLVRGIHFFGASAMVLLVGLHTIRVYLMAAYKYPREMNWLTGAVLLLLTLLMGFTGQLLRWDQNAVWSVIVGAEQASRVPEFGHLLARFILAGDSVGGATLSRFFAVHVFFIPAVIFVFIGAHLALVVRHGISEPPMAGRPVDPATYRRWYADMLVREGRPFWPDAAWRDVVFGVGMVFIIIALAALVGAPALGKPPDPTILVAYPRPDWYLLWYFAVLALIPPAIESWVIVLAPLLFGIALLLVPILSNRGERSPRRRPWAVAVVITAVVMIGVLWVAGARAAWSPDFNAPPLPEQLITANPEVRRGAQLFHDRGCENCHAVSGLGGHRGPDLTTVGDRLTNDAMIIRIMNGGTNMPPFAATLAPDELNALVAFLHSRVAPSPGRPATARPGA